MAATYPFADRQPAYGQVSAPPGPMLPNPGSAPYMIQHTATAPPGPTLLGGWPPVGQAVAPHPVYVTMATTAPGSQWLGNPLVAAQSLPNMGMQHPSLAALVYQQPPSTQPPLAAPGTISPQLLGQDTGMAGGGHNASVPPLHAQVHTVAPGDVMHTQPPMVTPAGLHVQNETQPPYFLGGADGLPPLDADMGEGGEDESAGDFDVGLFEGWGEEVEPPQEGGEDKGKPQGAKKSSGPTLPYEMYARRLDELVKRNDTGKELALRAFRLRLFFQLVAMGKKREQARMEIATLCGKGEYYSRQIRRDATSYIATGTLPDVPKHGGSRKKGTSTKPQRPKKKEAERMESPDNGHIWMQEFMGPQV